MSVDGIVSPRVFSWGRSATDADWEELYEAHLPRVYNFFRYRIGRAADVEDLTAMTFTKAWGARHRYRRDLAAFSTWLMTIARRVAIDHYRARRDFEPLDVAAAVASPARSAEQLAVLNSDAARLARLLEGLPDREREILALKYGAEMTNREIAKVSGLSESNVGSIVHRTLLALRAQW